MTMAPPPTPDETETPPTPEAIAATFLEPELEEGDEVSLSLSDFIERLGEGLPRFDEDFARRVGATLHAKAEHLSLPAVEGFGLVDVIVTLYMDRAMRLVVTGHHDETLAEVTLRWSERDFDSLGLRLHKSAREAPYTFATLDFSVRDRRGTLLDAIDGLAQGQEVTVRCLASIGPELHYRCLAEGREVAIPPEGLTLHPKPE